MLLKEAKCSVGFVLPDVFCRKVIPEYAECAELKEGGFVRIATVLSHQRIPTPLRRSLFIIFIPAAVFTV
jgi:hypothetical protein